MNAMNAMNTNIRTFSLFLILLAVLCAGIVAAIENPSAGLAFAVGSGFALVVVGAAVAAVRFVYDTAALLRRWRRAKAEAVAANSLGKPATPFTELPYRPRRLFTGTRRTPAQQAQLSALLHGDTCQEQ